MRTCPKCGTELPSSAKFCRGCGALLPEESPLEGQQPVDQGAASPDASRPAVQATTRTDAKAPSKKIGKRPWLKVAVLAAVVVAGVLVFKDKIIPAPSCETCDKIAELQSELQTVLAKNEDHSLTMSDYMKWDMQVSTLASELQLLKDHECTIPARKVKDQKYFYGRYEGTYTGEWKSSAPCGNGVFSGSYQAESTQYDCVYSGEWSAGAPNGVGALLERREYVGDPDIENWTTRRYEGAFADGKLTGNGWSSFESSVSEGLYEYYDGVYDEGFLQGQATYLQYKDGRLYDKGTVEGLHYTPIYSQRQEALNTLKTAGALLTAGVAAKYLFSELATAADLAVNGTNSKSFQGSGAERWLEQQRQSIQAWSDDWDRKQAESETWQKQRKENEKAQQERRWEEEQAQQDQRWEEEKLQREQQLENSDRLFNEWKTLESQAKWSETSRYDDERANADYIRRQAEDAEYAYNKSK